MNPAELDDDMPGRKTARERALELAASGKCQTVSDVMFWLRVEGYPQSQIEHPSVRSNLIAHIYKARTKPSN